MSGARIVISGLGGQGALTLTRLLAEAAMRGGFDVLTAETHGMAQRGGTVISMVKAGKYHSPLILPGTADLGIFLHPAGLAPHRRYLASSGVALVNAEAGNEAAGTRFVAADRLAREAGAPRAANLVMAGFAAGANLLPVAAGVAEETVAALAGARRRESNLAAFRAGMRAAGG